ncbi:MAG: tRNA (cytidine(56)-2'-O)-methyltransferase [Candidatus Bilamarchaeaceae archaeon]
MIIVIRLSHRLPRDERISSHVCLVARAFGADGVIYSGQHDSSLEESVKRVAEQWGGNFFVEYEKSIIPKIKEYKRKGYKIAHLTMYGPVVDEKISEIRPAKDLLVIVGSEHVPIDVYHLADWNLAVGNQPHSEVAALAVFLDRYFSGKQFQKEFKGKIKITPNERGKNIQKNE